jgi:hypothetical protein
MPINPGIPAIFLLSTTITNMHFIGNRYCEELHSCKFKAVILIHTCAMVLRVWVCGA